MREESERDGGSDDDGGVDGWGANNLLTVYLERSSHVFLYVDCSDWSYASHVWINI